MKKLSFKSLSIILLSVLLVLSTSIAIGSFMSNADAQNKFEYKLSVEVEDEYLRDSYFNIPTLTVKSNGKDYYATAKLIYPDNRASGNLKNYLWFLLV